MNDCVLVVSLEKGKLYTVTASGEAFMTESTGADADPFPGVVVLYATDEEDCYAMRQIVMTPGKSITFRSPWLIDPSAGVSLSAFFLDEAAGHPKRGSYTLTITEADDRDDVKRAQIEKWLRSHRPEARFTNRPSSAAMARKLDSSTISAMGSRSPRSRRQDRSQGSRRSTIRARPVT